MKRTHLIGLLALGGAIAGMGFGCSSDPVVDDGGEGGMGGMGTSTSSTGMGPGSTTSTGGMGGMAPVDESTSCADAPQMEMVTNNGVTFYRSVGYINPAGDSDYFLLNAQAGEWLQLLTIANEEDDPTLIDTVITLYNEDGSQQLAQVDDAFPRLTTDSEMFYRVETAGTYCLKVEEFSDWAGQTPEGGPNFFYNAISLPIVFADFDEFNEDTEPNDTLAAPQANLTYLVSQMSGLNFTQLAGVFDADTDVDVWQYDAPNITIDPGNIYSMELSFTPSGIDGFGGTTSPGIINIYDAADTTTALARLDVANGSEGFSAVPIVPGGSYLIEVEREAAGAAGSNPFYFMKMGAQLFLNQVEADDTLNNTSAGAESITPSPMTTSHFLYGDLPAGDEDWWIVPNVAAGQNIIVSCSAQRNGAGVGDLTVEYFSTTPGGAAVQTDTETAMQDILWADQIPGASQGEITGTAAGDHYFRMSSTTDIPGVSSRTYLCGIAVVMP